MTGVLMNGDKEPCCAGWSEGQSQTSPGLDFRWLHSQDGSCSSPSSMDSARVAKLAYMGSNKAHAPHYVNKAGWTGHALQGTSFCLLRGTGIFLCVETALL